MSGMNLPIMKIEVESMRQSMLHAFNLRHQDLLAVFNTGLDACLTELPSKLVREMKDMSEEIMEEAVRKAIKDYWETGAGRAAIDEAVAAKFKGALRV